MSVEELFIVLIGLLPVIKLEEKPKDADKCKYMVGT